MRSGKSSNITIIEKKNILIEHHWTMLNRRSKEDHQGNFCEVGAPVRLNSRYARGPKDRAGDESEQVHIV